MLGNLDGSISINRVSNDPYQVEYNLINLTDVAAKTRTLDPKYIINGCDITDSFKEYAMPLVGNLPVVESLRGR